MSQQALPYAQSFACSSVIPTFSGAYLDCTFVQLFPSAVHLPILRDVLYISVHSFFYSFPHAILYVFSFSSYHLQRCSLH